MRAVFVLVLTAIAVVATSAPHTVAATDPIITGEPPGGEKAPVPDRLRGKGSKDEASRPSPPGRTKAALPSGSLLIHDDPSTRAERLDALFVALKRAASEASAAPIAAKIQTEWSDSGSATVDLMLLRAGEAMARHDPGAALDFLEQAIALDPLHAESWNRRATVNYVASDYGKSLADIERTLSLEPRHWGALMGLGMILEDTDRKARALDAYMRVLEVYPASKGAQAAVGRLSEELAGQAI